MAPFDRSRTDSYWRSIVTMAPYCIISEIKARHWSKIAIFFTPHLTLTPPLGGGAWPSRNIAIRFGTEKLEWWGVRNAERSLRTYSLVLIQCTNVTDGQTKHDGISRATHSVVRQKSTHRSWICTSNQQHEIGNYGCWSCVWQTPFSCKGTYVRKFDVLLQKIAFNTFGENVL